MKYQVYPLLTGHFTVTFNSTGFSQIPGIDNIPSYIFLIVDENGEAIAVDTGFDINNIPGTESFGVKDKEQHIPDLIKQAGFDPLNIKMLILTHLHWDHTAGIGYFPNAEIILQSGEIEGLFKLRENEEISFNPGHWIDSLDRFILPDGSHEIMPGIEVIRTGGHTQGHQAVKIQGETGTILLIGDLPFSYEWLWSLIPDIFWNIFKTGKGKKFYWNDGTLPELEKWYKNKRIISCNNLKDYSMKDVQGMADRLVFSHERTLAEKNFL